MLGQPAQQVDVRVQGEPARRVLGAGRQARQHGAGVHVDGVVLTEQHVQLPQRQPAEVGMRRHLVVGDDDHVAVLLTEEP